MQAQLRPSLLPTLIYAAHLHLTTLWGSTLSCISQTLKKERDLRAMKTSRHRAKNYLLSKVFSCLREQLLFCIIPIRAKQTPYISIHENKQLVQQCPHSLSAQALTARQYFTRRGTHSIRHVWTGSSRKHTRYDKQQKEKIKTCPLRSLRGFGPSTRRADTKQKKNTELACLPKGLVAGRPCGST